MNYNAAGAHRQGTRATFPGKPTGKAGRQLAMMSQDSTDDSSSGSTDATIEETGEVSNRATDPVQKVLQNAIRAGRIGGKARIMVRKPTAPGTTRRKYKPGVRALKEIFFYQKEYGLICAKAAVAHLIRELCEEEKEGLRWQSSAILALHKGFKAYLVALFEDCVLEAIHGCRITVMPKDMFIALKI